MGGSLVSVVPLPQPDEEVVELRQRVAELERQVSEFHLHNAALESKRMFERFYRFDAIKNDACPCCGGRVEVVEETRPPSVVLRSTHGVIVEPSSGLKIWDREPNTKKEDS